MNNLLQMLLTNKMQQVPQQMMKQLENQLKRANPQAFQEFQKAIKNNENPNDYLNKVVNGFSPDKKEQWNTMMSNYGINTK